MNRVPYLEVDDATGTDYGGVGGVTAINDGAFHHVAFTRQGPTLRVYVDGALDNTGNASGTAFIDNTSPVVAGWSPCQPVGTTRFFNGVLDEIGLYHRALSATEIAAIWANGSGGKLGPQIIHILDVTRGGSNATLEWESLPGSTYRVQYKASLSDATWLAVPGDVTANGSTASKTNTPPAGTSQRFYRVMKVE